VSADYSKSPTAEVAHQLQAEKNLKTRVFICNSEKIQVISSKVKVYRHMHTAAFFSYFMTLHPLLA
jgi:hypothetical protein